LATTPRDPSSSIAPALREKAAVRQAWLDAAAAVSLANLVCYRSWGWLLAAHGANAYWMKADPKPVAFIALMGDVLLLGLLFFSLMRVARRLEWQPPSRARFALRAMLGVVAYAAVTALVLSVYTMWFEDTSKARAWGSMNRWTLVVAGCLALAFPIAYWIGSRKPFRGILLLLTILSPAVALVFAQSVLQVANYDPNRLADKPTAPRLSVPASAPHVLWVIFDEWDEDLTFAHRPAGLKLPEVDALRRDTFYSETVVTPGYATGLSMPALTIGKRVSSVRPVAPDELEIKLAGGEGTVRWSTYPNVFSEARKLGFNTSILSWSLPYCRVLNTSLAGCEWLTQADVVDDASLAAIMADQLRRLCETGFRSPFGQATLTHAHAWLYHHLLDKSKRIVSERQYNLTLLHLPVPHPPFFYNRVTGKDDYGATPIRSLFLSGGAGYVDALALVDRCIGELRRTMEAAGTWNDTTILFSADHPYRERRLLDGKPIVPYVPYLIKLAGQHQSLNCTTHFSALLTKDLLLAVLKKEISTPEELNAWILRHKDAFPVD
jgi:hypothetical protein